MQIICRGSKLWQLSACSVIAFLKYIQVFTSAENSMAGRAYVHGRSADTSLAEIHYEMSELFDKQVNAQKEKIFRHSRKLPQAHQKGVRWKWKKVEEIEKKRCAFLMGGESL